jgi:hypothetical protein
VTKNARSFIDDNFSARRMAEEYNELFQVMVMDRQVALS